MTHTVNLNSNPSLKPKRLYWVVRDDTQLGLVEAVNRRHASVLASSRYGQPYRIAKDRKDI